MEKYQPRVVAVGDIAFNTDRVVQPDGTILEQTSLGGSAYYTALGAHVANEHAGVVSIVGTDFPVDWLKMHDIDTEGVITIPNGKSARFILTQYNNTRTFVAERNVAENVDSAIIPVSYVNAQYIHLSTGLPQHQLIWLDTLTSQVSPDSTISVDTFETFAMDYPDETKQILKQAGSVFINEEELSILRNFGEVSFQVPVILKKGPAGAVYINNDTIYTVVAPKVDVVETTGAGDILAGAFLSYQAQGQSIEQSLACAVSIASRSVTQFGTDHLLKNPE